MAHQLTTCFPVLSEFSQQLTHPFTTFQRNMMFSWSGEAKGTHSPSHQLQRLTLLTALQCSCARGQRPVGSTSPMPPKRQPAFATWPLLTETGWEELITSRSWEASHEWGSRSNEKRVSWKPSLFWWEQQSWKMSAHRPTSRFLALGLLAQV